MLHESPVSLPWGRFGAATNRTEAAPSGCSLLAVRTSAGAGVVLVHERWLPSPEISAGIGSARHPSLTRPAEPHGRWRVRPTDVRVPLQVARARLARTDEGRAGHARTCHHAANRAPRQAPLNRHLQLGVAAARPHLANIA